MVVLIFSQNLLARNHFLEASSLYGDQKHELRLPTLHFEHRFYQDQTNHI